MANQQLYRIPEQGKIAGVAAGIADYFEIDPTIIRLLFIFAIFITSGGIVLIYIALALFLPVEGEASVTVSERINDLTEGTSIDRTRNWLGAGLIAIGAWYLVSYFWPGWVLISWNMLWPLVLVIIGVILLTKNRSR